MSNTFISIKYNGNMFCKRVRVFNNLLIFTIANVALQLLYKRFWKALAMGKMYHILPSQEGENRIN